MNIVIAIVGLLVFLSCIEVIQDYRERGRIMESLRNVNQGLIKREAELNQTLQVFEKKYQNMARQLDSFVSELDMSKEHFIALQKDRDAKNTEIAALVSERNNLIKKIENTKLNSSLMSSERNTLFEKSKKLELKLEKISQDFFQLISQNKSLLKQLDDMRTTERILRNTIQEAPLGFPSLLNALRFYDEKRDQKISDWLLSKKVPAPKASDIIKEETQKRRQAEYECWQAKCLLDYYRNIFPCIDDNDDMKEEALDPIVMLPPRDGEDVVERYLSREEYQQLSCSERNQIALDRFWDRNKSKRLIGKLYERYVGYLYEKQGYHVDYFGITEGLSDLGRDLICNNGDEILLIQCKNWSRSKTIYEKHIFQFFGTVYQFTKSNIKKPVRGAFYTATTLSETARSFAEEFNIELHENFPLERYPMIKCNVSRNGEGIYHLPFDLQYDATKINAKDGDRYCMTVAEAEAAGFRRAYRWRSAE